jgi:WD40 repeat protein
MDEKQPSMNGRRIAKLVLLSLPIVMLSCVFGTAASDTPFSEITGPTRRTASPTAPRLFTRTLEPLPPNTDSTCEAAFTSPVGNGSLSAPVLTLLKKEYLNNQWVHIRTPFLEANSVADARTLVCVRADRRQTGYFTDGKPAYQIVWKVRTVELSNGKVMGETELEGSDPLAKVGTGPGYGGDPVEKLTSWLGALLGDRTILFQGDRSKIIQIVFSPDGNTLATVALDGTLRFWDLPTGRETQKISEETGDMIAVSFSPDGKTVAAGGIDHPVKLIDAATGRVVEALENTDHTGFLDFSPDGKLLALGSSGDGTIRIWDFAAGKVVLTITASDKWVTGIDFSPDGKTLVSGSADNFVKLWNVSTGQLMRTLTGHTDQVKSVAFSPDGRTVASGSLDGTGRIWNADSGQEIGILTGNAGSILSVSFSPDGKMIASGGGFSGYMVRLWDGDTGRLVCSLAGHTNNVSSVQFSPDGIILASGGEDGIVKLWKTVELAGEICMP